MGISDFEKGKMAAWRHAKGDPSVLGKQCTCDEIVKIGGPDFRDGKGSQSPSWNSGWDAAIIEARNAQR